MSDGITIDFGDGVSALDRTLRTIVMIADGAIQSLTDMGWSRASINLEVDSENPLPCWVTLRKKRVFEIEYYFGFEGQLKIQGIWIADVKAPGFWDKLFGTV